MHNPVIKLSLVLWAAAASIGSVRAQQQSMVPSGTPSVAPSTLAPTGSRPVAVAPVPTAAPVFPTSPPAPSPDGGIDDQCINQVCTPGDPDDCACIPGLQCRQRSDGQGNFVFLCSAVSKASKNRLSEGAGGGGRSQSRSQTSV